MAYTKVDQRPQIERLIKECDKYYLKMRICYLLVLAAAIVIMTIILFDLPDITIILPIGIALTILVLVSFTKDKSIEFNCPRNTCPGSPVHSWRCGHCLRDNEQSYLNMLLGRPINILGGKCGKCHEASTNFICPHCNNNILLDGTRPPLPAATMPWLIKPKEQGGPLSGFTDDIVD